MQKKKTMNKRTGAAETDEQRISCRSSFRKPLRCRITWRNCIRRFNGASNTSSPQKLQHKLHAQTSTLWTLCAALTRNPANRSAPFGLDLLGFHGKLHARKKLCYVDFLSCAFFRESSYRNDYLIPTVKGRAVHKSKLTHAQPFFILSRQEH